MQFSTVGYNLYHSMAPLKGHIHLSIFPFYNDDLQNCCG
uniref:Uncharacterized protein n=1 Tax=Rhizophora mucronata TaxID=61149 RepID=A0A2P2NTI4_RHIMU